MSESYDSYLTMLKDSVRIGLWEAGVRQMVRPGDVVVEIGTGVGTFAIFAARAGAAKVYAIESDRVVNVAREVAASEGLHDRIEFIEGYSTAVAIPEVVNVVLYEDFSPFFFDTDMVKILGDARSRLLKSEGRILPRGASVQVCMFEDEKCYEELLAPLADETTTLYGLDLAPLRELLLNAPAFHGLTPESMLSEPCTAYRCDLRRQSPEPFSLSHTFTATRSGTAHGLAVWFDLDLGDGVELSNRPGTSVTSWQQGILPFEEPLSLAAGSSVEVEVRTVVSKLYGCYWNWTVRYITEPGPATDSASADDLPRKAFAPATRAVSSSSRSTA